MFNELDKHISRVNLYTFLLSLIKSVSVCLRHDKFRMCKCIWKIEIDLVF